MAYRLLLFFILLSVQLAARQIAEERCFFRVGIEHGIKGDGQTVNTGAIQKLIDRCSDLGGGVISFPAGQYVTGTILLKDGVTIRLEDDSELLGSTDISDYQMVDPFRTGNNAPMGYCFVGAVDAKNVGITGKGIINGRGSEVLKSGGKERRPFLVRFVRTEGIVLEGVKLMNSTAWTAHFFACKKIRIDRVSINSRGLGNNDGFDLDCSQDVILTNCDIDTGDDGLCFKTTWSQMACRDIVVKGLRITSNHAGIKFGTESMAPFENIKISDCYIFNTRNGGIKINSVDGAEIRNVDISGIVMDNVRTPLLVRLGSRLNVFRKESDRQQPTGTIDRVTIRNLKAKAAAEAQLDPPTGILITGVPEHYITNLVLENIDISLVGGGTHEDARHMVPEAEKEYPEVRTFGPTIPAWGIWARHVDGLKIKNVNLTLDNPDLRPAFIVQDGKDVEISRCRIPVSNGSESVIRFEDVAGGRVERIRAQGKADSFVRIEGDMSQDVRVDKNKLEGMEKTVEFVRSFDR